MQSSMEREPYEGTNFEHLFSIKKPRKTFVVPIETKEDYEHDWSPSLVVPKKYTAKCDRTEEEQYRLRFMFTSSLKSVYDMWARDRLRRYSKLETIRTPKETSYLPWKENFAIFSRTRYPGSELDDPKTIDWMEEFNNVFYGAIHNISSSPPYEMFAELDNWKSPDFVTVIKMFSDQLSTPDPDFDIKFRTKFQIHQPKLSTIEIINKVNDFLSQYAISDPAQRGWFDWIWRRAPQPPQPQANPPQPQANPPQPVNYEQVEANVTKFLDTFKQQIFTSVEEKACNLPFVYRTILRYIQERLESIKIPDLQNVNYVTWSTLLRMTRDEWTHVMSSNEFYSIPWYQKVQGQFQLQLLLMAYTRRNYGISNQKHFQAFSDYIFGTCH
jgi:hypothetical protein